MTGDARLRWTTRPGVGRLPVYVAECRQGEYLIVPDYDGWALHCYPPGSDRSRPLWERGPFPTVKTAKAAARLAEYLASPFADRVLRRAVSRYKSRPGSNFNFGIVGMGLQNCVFRLLRRRWEQRP
jgi:hypothetical protein